MPPFINEPIAMVNQRTGSIVIGSFKKHILFCPYIVSPHNENGAELFWMIAPLAVITLSVQCFSRDHPVRHTAVTLSDLAYLGVIISLYITRIWSMSATSHIHHVQFCDVTVNCE